MLGPFPGMNPFLEDQAIWPAFHHQMVTALRQHLLPKLDAHYYVCVTERRYSIEPPPNVHGLGDEQREQYVEIHAANGGSLVTLVDVVSPANKATESGRRAYFHTRQQGKELKANVVEIDLVLRGQPTLDYLREDLPDCDYAVTVSRAIQPDRLEMYTTTLQKPLPRFRLPVVATRPDIIMDLQDIFKLAYERGGFARQIRYRHESDEELKEASRCRLRELLNKAIQEGETSFTYDEIALAAYFIWKEQGCPEGRAHEHWQLGIERLRQGRANSGSIATTAPIKPG